MKSFALKHIQYGICIRQSRLQYSRHCSSAVITAIAMNACGTFFAAVSFYLLNNRSHAYTHQVDQCLGGTWLSRAKEWQKVFSLFCVRQQI